MAGRQRDERMSPKHMHTQETMARCGILFLRSLLRPIPSSQAALVTRRPYSKDAPVAPVIGTQPLYLKEYHEPQYLEKMKPKIPFYEYFNIQLRGYDFAVVESLAKLVTRLCKDAGLTVEKFWAVPAVTLKYETYGDDSSVFENSEEIKIHERTVQVKHMTTAQLAILVDVINQAKPPGVIVSFMEHNQGHEDVRYIPDLKLAALEKELEEVKKPISVQGKS